MGRCRMYCLVLVFKVLYTKFYIYFADKLLNYLIKVFFNSNLLFAPSWYLFGPDLQIMAMRNILNNILWPIYIWMGNFSAFMIIYAYKMLS